MTGQTVSACLIVLDEEARLPAALASVAFCDEVVVVDSGSTDRTREIARAAGAVVVEQPWLGFGAQRNVALDAATSDWVLEVDADERITPALAGAIRGFLADEVLTGRFDTAMLPMRHRFLGGWLDGTMRYPGYRQRLFRRTAYRHDEGRRVHEGLWPNGAAWPLDAGTMEHELAGTWAEALRDTRAYVQLEAEQFAPEVSARAVAGGLLARPAVKAAYRVAVDGAWRDGWRGLARVGLESVADGAVWLRAARGGAASAGAGGDRADGAHFGSTGPRRGPVRIVGIAGSPPAARAARAWLADAAAAGADVALVTTACWTQVRPGDTQPSNSPAPAEALDGDAGDGAVRVRMAGTRPLDLVRAVNAEDMLRPVDAVLVAGRPARIAARLARTPAAVAALDLGEPPAAAAARVHGLSRA